MKPWIQIDSSPIPRTNGVMHLMRRDDEWVIRVDGHILMSTRMHGSEDALAELAFDRLGGRTPIRTLVGGLGMGFTARAALNRCAPSDRVVVAELVPAIVDWNRGPLGEAAGRPLDDPRLEVHAGDVCEPIRTAKGRWDMILLDVDNGPDGLTAASNQWLYTRPGLVSIYQALSRGGVLGVWSVEPDSGFTDRLKRAGFEAESVRVRAHRGRGSRHVVWMARKP